MTLARNNKQAVFRCDSNASEGFGHTSRCISLARSLASEHGFEIVFLGDFGKFAESILRSHSFEIVRCIEDQPSANTLLSSTYPDALLIIDHYGVTAQFVDTMASAKRNPVYFVDEDLIDYTNKALALISIRLTGQEMQLERFSVPLFSGADFLVVNPEFRELRLVNCTTPVRHPVQAITIFLSGTKGQLHHERQIICSLDRVAPQANLTLITNQPQAHQSFTRQQVDSSLRTVAPTPHMARYLDQTDLLICGGGLLKYEAAYSAIPSAICSLVALQHKDTQEFCARGLAWDLGQAYSDSYETTLEARLEKVINDHQLRQHMRNCSQSIFRDDSTNHLASELVALKASQD